MHDARQLIINSYLHPRSLIIHYHTTGPAPFFIAFTHQRDARKYHNSIPPPPAWISKKGSTGLIFSVISITYGILEIKLYCLVDCIIYKRNTYKQYDVGKNKNYYDVGKNKNTIKRGRANFWGKFCYNYYLK